MFHFEADKLDIKRHLSDFLITMHHKKSLTRKESQPNENQTQFCLYVANAL